MAIKATTIPVEAAANTLLKPHERINSEYELTVTFGTDASETELAVLTPCGFNKSTGKWGAWIAPDPTILTVSLVSASSGTFTVTVNGVTTAAIDYDATDADVIAALLAIGVTVTDTLDTSVHTITVTDLNLQTVLPSISGDVSSISGGTPTAVATAGTATNGLHVIKGFVYPNVETLDDSDDCLVVISPKCEIHYDGITGAIGTDDEDALKVALKQGLIADGIYVQGLPGIA